MDIRTVTVELLRAGPRHNQLVSPITQYLGVCGNAPAGVVTLPYEHGELEQRLQQLRYTVSSEEDAALTSKVLDRTGREVAGVLAAIPGLSGMLNPEDARPQTLTHLRIVLSASELAMLPFEAAKVPTGAGASPVWLALQARTPVCITRHIRSVSADRTAWPNDPRVLFVAGPDTPVAQHTQALSEALAPWRDRNASLDDRLVILKDVRLADISREIAAAAARGAPFTHVHILAHGAPIDASDRYSPVGVSLHDDEVIDGQRLATTLIYRANGRVNVPAVVTLATCDSGKLSDVRTMDASVAHDLHDQGIPLVVASQFPLSEEGSVAFVKRFYQGQLWGEHPLISLYDSRLQLHSQMPPDTHDWASLVVYEALPVDLSRQLEELAYWQARRAHEGALQRLEAVASTTAHDVAVEAYEERVREAMNMSARLPQTGDYALECAGLRGGGQKRIAQTTFNLATRAGFLAASTEKLLAESRHRLDQARTEYWQATKSLLSSWALPGRKKANLHWLLGQVMSLDVVLGRPLDEALLAVARLAAEIDQDAPQDGERAWAHVSLCEFALLRLADPAMSAAQRARHAEESVEHASRFLELLGPGSEQVFNTARQFARYVDWWGNSPPGPHWNEEHGIVPTARRIVALLRGSRPSGPSQDVPRDGEAAVAQPPSASVAAHATSPAPPHMTERTFAIEMLPAGHGDSLWIEYGDKGRPCRVLVDCGARSAAEAVLCRIRAAVEPPDRCDFELFVLTHIDSDHIDGVLPLFESAGFNARFEDIWFNGKHQVSRFLSVKQGEDFSKLLADPKLSLPWNRIVTSDGDKRPAPIVIPKDLPPPTFPLPGGLQLTLLSPGVDQLRRLALQWPTALAERKPTKKMLGRKKPPPPVADFDAFDLAELAKTPTARDPSVANGSSIALLAEFDGRVILLTGDAHADVLARSIRALQRARGKAAEKLRLDALKLSHHGSANATTLELLKVIDCPRYLVSSNGNMFYHPDREAIARVILHGGANPTLYFNYRSELNGIWENQRLQQRYSYSAVYPSAGEQGLRVPLL